jgi:2-oxoglutarate ferredoxin oxidoreductase subunit beta
MVKIEDYSPATAIAWCPGCGNFGILRALGQALVELEIPPHQVLLVSGIGQAGKLPHYMRGNVLNELHGRAVPAATAAKIANHELTPAATAAKIANHELTVIAVSGDGDGYGEGGNHWIAAMHRNVDMIYIVHNNQIYGLTKGQASPTSDLGFVTKTTPLGAGPRIKHRGFALIDVLQPCVAFNHKNTYQWYRERVYKLDEEDGYDPSDKLAAFDKAQEWGDRIPIGVIYRKERATFEEQIPALKKGVLVKQKHDPKRVKKLFEEFL